jgi:hypothetical protein
MTMDTPDPVARTTVSHGYWRCMVLAGQPPSRAGIGRIPKLMVRVRFSSPAPRMSLQVGRGP